MLSGLSFLMTSSTKSGVTGRKYTLSAWAGPLALVCTESETDTGIRYERVRYERVRYERGG